jgi:hypothetical protein
MAEASPVSVDTVSPDAEGASPAPIRGLLNGEIVVASVRKVLRYNTGVLASGEYGVLYVTNFRIVFAGAEKTEVNQPSRSLLSVASPSLPSFVGTRVGSVAV